MRHVHPSRVDAREREVERTRGLDVQSEIGMNLYEKYVGQTFRVLCTGTGRTGSGTLTGKTPQDVIVDFDGDEALIGSFVDVKIEKALNWALIGEIQQ